MSFYRGNILFASVLTLIAISSLKALAYDKANFAKLIQDPSEQQTVLNAAKQASVVLQNPCPSAEFTFVNQFTIYQPLQFDVAGKIIAGAWKQTVLEKGCGQERVLGVLACVDEQSNSIKAIPLCPGSTRADPTLQKDAVMYAVIAAACADSENCKTIYVADTKFLNEVGEPLEGVKDKPWDELWTLNICGKKAQVTMHFIPDKTGTTINTSPTETKFLPSDSNHP